MRAMSSGRSRCTRKSLRHFDSVGNPEGIVEAIEWLATAAAAIGEADSALRLFGAAEAAREALRLPPRFESDEKRVAAGPRSGDASRRGPMPRRRWRQGNHSAWNERETRPWSSQGLLLARRSSQAVISACSWSAPAPGLKQPKHPARSLRRRRASVDVTLGWRYLQGSVEPTERVGIVRIGGIRLPSTTSA